MKPRTLTPALVFALALPAAGAPPEQPLLDADGYPLVGNLVGKGDPKPAPTPTPSPPKPKPPTRA